jgi:hypothetical protein
MPKKNEHEDDTERKRQSDVETDNEKGESDQDREAAPESLMNSRWFSRVD